MTKTYVIGDIHGAAIAVKQLIEKLPLQKQDTVIFLGDYVDGWSQSAETITYLLQLNELYNCIFIRGNHDSWCEEWLQSGYANETWLFHGGRSTIASYAPLNEQEKCIHLGFFNRMLNYHVDDENRLFIHAGFSSMHGPEKEHYASNYSWDRTLWEMALTMDKRIKKDSKLYPKRLLLFKEIYIGHTPTQYYDVNEPMQACNVWNLDTGAAFTGRLSAMEVNTHHFWQSDICQDLYPEEKGRN
ncbi:MAG: metallophosphoesterase family protein [Ferruginibacter sp.]